MNKFTIVKSLQFPFIYLYEQGLPEHISLKVEKKKGNRLDTESCLILPINTITLWLHDLIQKKKNPNPIHVIKIYIFNKILFFM